MRLCLALGCPHPDYLPLSLSQYMDWVEFDAEQPIGYLRTDVQSGIIAAAIAGGEPMKYMPFYRRPAQSAEEQMRVMESFLSGP